MPVPRGPVIGQSVMFGMRFHGSLKIFILQVGSSTITPVIGYIGNVELSTLRLNKAEVERVFALPLKQLVDPALCRHTSFRQHRFPVFLGGPRRVWGLTATILDLALSHILPQYTPLSRVMLM